MKRSPLRRKTPMRRTPSIARNPGRSKIPPAIREAVRARSYGSCEIGTQRCTIRGGHLHHRRMRSQGGKHTVDNLLDTCPQCHSYIHGHPEESYQRGWLIRSSP